MSVNRTLSRLVATCGLLLLGVGVSGAAPGAPPSEIFIFGNSLSDTGNIQARTLGFFPPDPPYADGRFSNGPVWVEYLAVDLALTVVPNGSNPAVIQGNNFAFGGAQAADDVPIFPFGFIPSVQNQVGSFVAAAGTVPPDALYTVFGGGNDCRFAANPSSGLTPQEQQQVIQEAVNAMVDAVSMLAAAGAQEFVVPNLPDLGATPEAFVIGNAAEATSITLQFNTLLAAELDAAELILGVDILQFDTFAFLGEVIDDAVNNGGQIYGITNIDVPIAPGLPGDPRSGPVADDPDTALWADDIHPSTVAHAGFAAAVLAMLNPPAGDIDGDGVVGPADLALLLGARGPCEACPADLNADGLVDAADLAVLLGNWG